MEEMTITRTITFDKTLRDRAQRVAFKHALDDMGVTLTSSSSFERVFSRIKAAADSSGEIRGDRLQAIVDEVEAGLEVFRGVSDSFR